MVGVHGNTRQLKKNLKQLTIHLLKEVIIQPYKDKVKVKVKMSFISMIG